MQTSAVFANEDWDLFNSSLLIEVSRPTGVFTCTGVAVTPELIVTAAHCLDGDILKVRVYTQNYYDPKADSLEVKSFKLHSDYRPKKSRYSSDLAKIQLKTKLPDSIKILPIFTDQIIIGDIYRFGFGERNKKNLRTVVTPKLRKINPVERVLELNDKYSYSGDSGGPIFLKKGKNAYVVAIHSTLSFGPEGKYSYNPLLSSYKNWIFEN